MRWAALCMVLALSGCLGGDGGEPGGPAPDPDPSPTAPTPTAPPVKAPNVIPMLLEYTFSACDGIELQVPVPHATAQAAIPEGYTAVSEPDALDRPWGRVHYAIFGCDALSTAATTVNDTVYGFVAVAVEGEERDTFYTIRMLANAGIMENLWTAAGYDPYVGAYAREDPTNTGRYAEISLEDYTFQGVAQGDEQIHVEDRRFDSLVASGLLIWNQTGADTRGRPVHGDFAVPADDPFASQAKGIQSGHFWQDVTWGPNDLWLRRA